MTKVVVAMSGGVDSSVAAALLKQQGYDVTGMMLRLWSEEGKEDSNRCCTPDAMALARRVAAKLDIPFYVIDAKEVFRETVVKYFLDGYSRGETPNPCLVCNRQIRWTFLLEHAVALGADLMATGHYARLRRAGKWHASPAACGRCRQGPIICTACARPAKAKQGIIPRRGLSQAGDPEDRGVVWIANRKPA